MKTSELTGAALDWAVDKAEGRIRPDGGYYCGHHGKSTRWSTDWSQGGPIIEREVICIGSGLDALVWYANKGCGQHHRFGRTPLIAAMRCYVASKLGDEVDIPEELV